MSDTPGPRRTFDDVKAPEHGTCRQCGETVAANLYLSIRRLTGGQGSPAVAAAKWRLCEHHAVEAFEKIVKAFPGSVGTRDR